MDDRPEETKGPGREGAEKGCPAGRRPAKGGEMTARIFRGDQLRTQSISPQINRKEQRRGVSLPGERIRNTTMPALGVAEEAKGKRTARRPAQVFRRVRVPMKGRQGGVRRQGLTRASETWRMVVGPIGALKPWGLARLAGGLRQSSRTPSLGGEGSGGVILGTTWNGHNILQNQSEKH